MNFEDVPSKEKRLIVTFLSKYRELLKERTGYDLNPRNLSIISQPDMNNSNVLDWIAYDQWFDEVSVGTNYGSSKNLLEVFLDIPLNMLINAEEKGIKMLSKKDTKKLAKAMKLLSEITIERQNEKS